MRTAIERYVRCLRLNARMGGLVLRNRWLRESQFAAGYDRVADGYESQWMAQIRPVTDTLLAWLPREIPPGSLLDLGCGTGYTTAELLRRYRGRPLAALDLSSGMLAAARRRVGDVPQVTWLHEDMLAHLRRRPSGGTALIVSTWAIGYSRHRQVVREAGRVLVPGGTLAFVVNYADTLRPVFDAFHRCLARFPGRIRLALWPDFPRDWQSLRSSLDAAGLDVRQHADGNHPVQPPANTPCFDWLLTTGVLAGFDAVLPLHEPGPVADFMREELSRLSVPLTHHYASVLAVASRGAPS